MIMGDYAEDAINEGMQQEVDELFNGEGDEEIEPCDVCNLIPCLCGYTE
jgi:hypothetical protein